MSNKTAPIIGLTTYQRPVPQLNLDISGLMTSYIEAVRKAGGIPVLIPSGATEAELLQLFQRIDGLIIPGGGDVHPSEYNGNEDHPNIYGVDRARDKTEIFLAQQAAKQEKPVLAICRGHQVFNVAMGGTLYEDLLTQFDGSAKHDYFGTYPRTHLPHDVTVAEDSLLAEVLGTTTPAVNSLHHQGIRDLAPGLRAVAAAPDGVIEGVELPEHPFALGVQWHPENLVNNDPAMLRLFRGLIAAAQNT